MRFFFSGDMGSINWRAGSEDEHGSRAETDKGGTHGLVPVAQVHGAPARRLCDDVCRPRPVGQVDGLELRVAVERHRRRLLRIAHGVRRRGSVGVAVGVAVDGRGVGHRGGRREEECGEGGTLRDRWLMNLAKSGEVRGAAKTALQILFGK